MTNPELNKVLEKHLPNGIVKGIEFLLTPKTILPFIDDLAAIGVLINGCDLWYYLDTDKDPMRIVESVGAGMLVKDPDPPETITPQLSANQVKDFIINQLPEDVDLLSLIFMDSDIYDFFRRKRNL
jgi:hypothetical protein